MSPTAPAPQSSRPFSRDGIKLAAMLTMACNHFAIALLPAQSIAYEVLTDIGYFTARCPG